MPDRQQMACLRNVPQKDCEWKIGSEKLADICMKQQKNKNDENLIFLHLPSLVRFIPKVTWFAFLHEKMAIIRQNRPEKKLTISVDNVTMI